MGGRRRVSQHQGLADLASGKQSSQQSREAGSGQGELGLRSRWGCSERLGAISWGCWACLCSLLPLQPSHPSVPTSSSVRRGLFREGLLLILDCLGSIALGWCVCTHVQIHTHTCALHTLSSGPASFSRASCPLGWPGRSSEHMLELVSRLLLSPVSVHLQR